MNRTRGQSYCLTNPGISFWFYVLLVFPYHPDKKLSVVAYRGEGMERKKMTSTTTWAARTMYLYHCTDFKASVGIPYPCGAQLPRCYLVRAQGHSPSDAREAVWIDVSSQPPIHPAFTGQSHRVSSSASLPFPAMERQRLREAVISGPIFWLLWSFCSIMLMSDWLKHIFLLGT